MIYWIYRYTVPGNPATKKNHMAIIKNRASGAPMLIQSKTYKDYERKAAPDLRPLPPSPIDEPVTVRCVFFMATRRRVDLCNLEAAAHDILVRCGVLADDCRDVIASTDGSRVLYDRERPRVEIEITPFEEEYTIWKEKPCPTTNSTRSKPGSRRGR